MNKALLLLWVLSLSLFAQKVEVSADKLEVDEKSGNSVLSGHVQIHKGADFIQTDRLIIRFDPKHKPTRYEAEGEVRFQIHTQNRIFVGHAQRLLYDPLTLRYELEGSVELDEEAFGQKLIGEKVVIDRTTGKAVIDGKANQPVKLIFDVKEQ